MEKIGKLMGGVFLTLIALFIVSCSAPHNIEKSENEISIVFEPESRYTAVTKDGETVIEISAAYITIAPREVPSDNTVIATRYLFKDGKLTRYGEYDYTDSKYLFAKYTFEFGDTTFVFTTDWDNNVIHHTFSIDGKELDLSHRNGNINNVYGDNVRIQYIIAEPSTSEDPSTEPSEPSESSDVESFAKVLVDSALSTAGTTPSGVYTESGETATFTYSGPFGGLSITPNFGDKYMCASADVVLTLSGPAATEESEGSGEAVFTPSSFKMTTAEGKSITITDLSDTTDIKNLALTLTDVSGTVSGLTISDIDTGASGTQSVTQSAAGTLTASKYEGKLEEVSGYGI